MIEKYVTSLIQKAVEPVMVRASNDVIQYFQYFYQDQIATALAIVFALVGLSLVYLIVE